MFKDVNECIDWLENIQKFGQIYNLDRMKKACEILENPEKKFKSIHIGGTNGKGSTTTFVKNILMSAGYKVGTYTSPYIVVFNERLSINQKYITDEDLLTIVNEIYLKLSLIEKEIGSNLTFFEVVTLISFVYFSKADVDYVIYEVGLGGMLDATNVLSPMICAITNIGYDHIDILGPNLEDVARNKLGIVKPTIPLVTTEQKFKDIFENTCNLNNSPIYIIDEKEITNIVSDINFTSFDYFDYKGVKLKMLGFHQVKNASLAIEIVRKISDLDNLNLSIDCYYNGLFNATWPGRLEILNNNPLVIIDGAHNIDGIKTLCKSAKTIFKNKSIHTVFCAMKDKDLLPMIEMLDDLSETISFTSFPFERCANAESLFDISTSKNKSYNENSISLIKGILDSVNKNDVILITGSLYFISYVRKNIMKYIQF